MLSSQSLSPKALEKKLKNVKVVTASLLIMLNIKGASAWPIIGPTTYNDCILEKMKDIRDETAATAIMKACASKFPDTIPSNEKDCKRRGLSPVEYGKLQMTSKISLLNYFTVDLYNGNSDISIDEMTVTVIPENTKKRQTYKLNFPYPTGPLSIGAPGAAISNIEGTYTWEVNSIATCGG